MGNGSENRLGVRACGGGGSVCQGEELGKGSLIWQSPPCCGAGSIETRYALNNLEHSGLHKVIISNLAKGKIIKGTLEKLQVSDSSQFTNKEIFKWH